MIKNNKHLSFIFILFLICLYIFYNIDYNYINKNKMDTCKYNMIEEIETNIDMELEKEKKWKILFISNF